MATYQTVIGNTDYMEDENGNGQIIDITYYTAKALGDTLKERNGQRAIRVNGGGMDLGYHLVHSLATVLYFGQDRAGYKLSHEWA